MEFDLRKWISQVFSTNVLPPFSLKLAGKPIEKIVSRFQFSATETKTTEKTLQSEFIYTDTVSNVVITCKVRVYPEVEALDLVLYLSNSGSRKSPLIEALQVFDMDLAGFLPEGTDHILHHMLGSDAKRCDFQPIDDPILLKKRIELGPSKGRSSEIESLPFFNIEAKGSGAVFIGVGWSGRWTAQISKVTAEHVMFKVGMKELAICLEPGETIRSPSVLLFPWRGVKIIDGHNAFRRFLMASIVPRLNNAPARLPFAAYGCRDGKRADEANFFTEANQIEYAAAMAQFKLDYHWIDAGWFEGLWPNGVGSWIIRKDGFPRGFRPISDAVKQYGTKLLVWFEPERVHQGTWLAIHHPEWCLTIPKKKNMLFDLGNPDARNWLTEHISKMIREEGIGLFRIDFNHDPLPFWKRADARKRKGIHEIRHIEGLYLFWDDLRQRFPDMLIDNCASGGRRIDLETISRSVALWRTDYPDFEPIGMQCHTQSLHLYLPTNSTGNDLPIPYRFRSAMNNGVLVFWDPFKPNFDPQFASRLVNEYKQIRDLYYGDFYPLTPYSMQDNTWCAYQFQRPEERRGMVVIFRRNAAPQATEKIAFQALNPATPYRIELSNEQLELRSLSSISGDSLLAGYEFNIPTAPGSILVKYFWD